MDSDYEAEDPCIDTFMHAAMEMRWMTITRSLPRSIANDKLMDAPSFGLFTFRCYLLSDLVGPSDYFVKTWP